ncbi:excinuclease ABC subunit UvrB [Euzebya tangerina]|uniref:excinuclease ABC subunit UvrB n=1 Tax=Euzebya tangerina TaxID=591198 RepID=UPI000E30CB7C|nr:excinuclease ABC subunit UvrB [Euzebya tangerina]
MPQPADGRFQIVSDYEPAGDQPRAITAMADALARGESDVCLLGVTGSGKTFTMANLIAEVQRPTLVMAPNKTLAAQLAGEFREFFPHNAVEYFVSYYDYYQPEAYVPSSDTYIEKDSSINDEIERLRHEATMALMTRRDVLIVASVSCIYGLGSPEQYEKYHLMLSEGQDIELDGVIRRLVDLQYERNELNFVRGKFRVRGDTLEIFPSDGETAWRLEFFGDTIDRITRLEPITGELIGEFERVNIFPNSHYITGGEGLATAIGTIEAELAERLEVLEGENKMLEAQRLRMRTNYDLEMLREIGICSGIENYSRHLDGRKPGETPYTLMDYFPDDFMIIADESHVTIPQVGGMYEGDRSRKLTLVEHGFRLPSALDNRPLTFEEFRGKAGQTVHVSATPGPFEKRVCQTIVEQVIRPTGLVDPEVVLRPTKGQIDDLIAEIREHAERDERVLVTTLTKKMSEDLTDYLLEAGLKVRYLHSEINTVERVEILRELRLGHFDALIGINLLREGLDLPEVALVAILDADKEGFLRSETSLIQTIGRAARNIHGRVVMYADNITDSMRSAISETNRRRQLQQQFNAENGIDPQTIRKRVGDIIQMARAAEAGMPYQTAESGSREGAPGDVQFPDVSDMPADELGLLIQTLTDEMHQAAAELKFEYAARLRDEIGELKRELRGMAAAT